MVHVSGYGAAVLTGGPDFEDDDALWRRCELAWGEWLRKQGGVVTRLGDAHGNHRGAKAPLIELADRAVRAPDFQTVLDGKMAYWEVKFRTRPHVDHSTGAREHWVERTVLEDYVAVARGSGVSVTMVLHEAPTALAPARWLAADVVALSRVGRAAVRLGRGGKDLEAWSWPVEAMRVIDGPMVDMTLADQPFTADEGDAAPLTSEHAEAMSGALRAGDAPVHADALLEQSAVALLALSKRLGLPSIPQYSVLRVGRGELDPADVLLLVDHGIRVFVVSDAPLPDVEGLGVWRAARLVESAIVAGSDLLGEWAVDGDVNGLSDAASKALEAADVPGGINVGQFRVVHQPADSDVVVTAGAGTGKTETMSERIVFLLATDRSRRAVAEPLVLNHMVLLTFTKEAAAEMRARIARTLIIRQRLCPVNVLPTAAWLTQLSGAQVTTIHSYAKRLVAQNGAVAGFGPTFRVAQHTLARRALVFEALGEPLEELYGDYASSPKTVPPAHEWQRQLDVIWEALQNFGVQVMPFTWEQPAEVDWGTSTDPLQGRSGEVFEHAVLAVASSFTQHCREQQAVPTGQLVTLAQSVLETVAVLADPPRHIFIDEFQDTDAMQMSLLLKVATLSRAPMFVVGDAKQGIYRFRGAEGDAFEELARRMGSTALEPMTLSKNWRSGATLLDSLHPYFGSWGEQGLLPYAERDRLEAGSDQDHSREVVQVRDSSWTEVVTGTVEAWTKEHPRESIAVLCRENFRALEAQAALRERGVACDVLVGGDFFRAPAVVETLVFLRAVLDPSDDVSLLQLMESRWAAVAVSSLVSGLYSDEDRSAWEASSPEVMAWGARAAHFGSEGSFDLTDLVSLRDRLQVLRSALVRTPVLAWLIECIGTFEPYTWQHADEDDARTELDRYARCLNHLVAMMDETFAEAPVSIDQLVDWLRLQVATNDREDEPFEEDRPGVVAITVHKSKGREFDRVVVVTDTRFQLSSKERAEAVVLRGASGTRLLWRWYPYVGGLPRGTDPSFGNATKESWSANDEETVREEARLLYVAMTRARHELVLALPTRRPRADPRSWADLVEGA